MLWLRPSCFRPGQAKNLQLVLREESSRRQRRLPSVVKDASHHRTRCDQGTQINGGELNAIRHTAGDQTVERKTEKWENVGRFRCQSQLNGLRTALPKPPVRHCL